MDGAERSADKVAQQILPTQPHHLSLSIDRRFPESNGWWYQGPSGALQHATYVSAAQRGVLLTRAGFEIVDKPQQPMATKLLANKGEIKKKMSLMDYRNKKKSASPVENGPSARPESKTNGTLPAKPPPPNDGDNTEDAKAVQKSQALRQVDAPSEKPRPETNGERSKPSQANPPTETESRKRPADNDGNTSSQKRAKHEVSTTKSDQPRQGALERLSRDTKTENLHPKVNGLAPSSMDRDRETTASPRSTIQVNGSRPRSDSGTSTPRKPEAVSKSGLPELLSPLHPSLFDSTPKKKLPDKPAKPEKAEGPSPLKKAKKPLKLPPLLSPTLPPVVEEALAAKERKPTASKTVPSQQSNQTADSSNGARKTIVAAPPIRVVEEEGKPSRPSRIVTFKFKKATAKRVKELLSLPSKSAKDALKKERSTSIEATPPPAKKRPRPADDVPQDTVAAKRPKAAAEAIPAKPPPRPTTPLKPAAPSMSRVASSQSQSNTPGVAAGVTPGSTSDNRPPTRSEPLDPKTLAQVEFNKERHAEYTRLGSKLKHTRDDLVRGASSNGGMTAAEERRATALHFEMVLAYMVAFHSLNTARMLERRMCDISGWESLLPHFNELRNRVAGARPLKVMAVQMHVLCLEQITNGFASLDPAAAAGGFTRWTKHNRNRAAMWGEANALFKGVENERLRTLVGPWTTVEEAVVAALGIMRRWADRDGVRWTPEINLGGGKEKDVAKNREGDREDREDRGRDRERERERNRRERERERDRSRDRPRPVNGSRYGGS
ncbi:hypothetical protein VTI74DRAFT_7915 [Chaetomium olivicolor]